MTHTFNRRAVLTSTVPAIAVGTLPSLASAPMGAFDLLPQWLVELDYVNGIVFPTDEELDIACGPMDELERKICAAPTHSALDFATKLVVYTNFGAYDDNNTIREAANLLGQSHRIPKWLGSSGN